MTNKISLKSFATINGTSRNLNNGDMLVLKLNKAILKKGVHSCYTVISSFILPVYKTKFS